MGAQFRRGGGSKVLPLDTCYTFFNVIFFYRKNIYIFRNISVAVVFGAVLPWFGFVFPGFGPIYQDLQ